MQLPDLNPYRLYLLTNGRKASTVQRHLNVLKGLLSSIKELSKEEVNSYILRLKLENKRHSYLNQVTDTVRMYARFIGVSDDLVSFRRFKAQAFAKATMSDQEIEDFLALPCPQITITRRGKSFQRPTDPVGWSIYRMFFTICAYTGMRMGEVASLSVNDLDFGRGVIQVEDSKTNTPRAVPMPSNLEEPLKAYLGGLKTTFLFPSRRGKGVLGDVDWNYNFKVRLKQLGISRTNLTPYSLRHSLITRLLEEDVNLFKVQKIVGHKRISTTAQYEHLTTKDIKQAIEKDRLGRTGKAPRLILLALLEAVTNLFERDERFEKTIEDKGDEVVIKIKVRPHDPV